MALGFTTATALPEHGGEAGPSIGKEGMATNQPPQFQFCLIALPELEGGQGGTGAGHREIGPGFGRRFEVAARRIPMAKGTFDVAQVVKGGGIKGIPLQNPQVVSGGVLPETQGFLGGAAVEMGIRLVGSEGNRTALGSDGSGGIPQGQQHIAPVAPGRRILRGLVENRVPKRKGCVETTLTAGAKGLPKQSFAGHHAAFRAPWIGDPRPQGPSGQGQQQAQARQPQGQPNQ